MKKTIAFPVYLDGFGDYHEFDTVALTLAAFGVKGVKCLELEFDGTYRGIFYIGAKTAPAVKALVKKHDSLPLD